MIRERKIRVENNLIVWDEESLSYLREHFPHECANDIADYFGVSITTIKKKAKSMGLQKAPGYTPLKYRDRYTKDYKYGK